MKTPKNYYNCDTYKELHRTKNRNHAFGDEGSMWADIGYEAELEEECEGCKNSNCPYNQ